MIDAVQKLETIRQTCSFEFTYAHIISHDCTVFTMYLERCHLWPGANHG